MTTAGFSLSFSYGYVLITLLFFILNNVKHTKNDMAIKCRFHSTLQLSFETYCASTNTLKVIRGMWAGTHAGLLVKWLLQSQAYLKENCNGSTIFHKFSSTKFQDNLFSSYHVVTCVHLDRWSSSTWPSTGMPVYLKINSNIHPGSSYQATSKKCCSHNWVDVQCFAQTLCYNVTKTCIIINKKFAVKGIFNTVKATLNIQ
jgi:hypothetical protein